jgi:uncharacterized RDD family membrane protein YckC
MKTITLSRNSKKTEIQVTPKATKNSNVTTEYAGFHRRMFATLIDLLLVGILFSPIFALITNLIHGNVLPVEVINNAAERFSELSKSNNAINPIVFFQTDPIIQEYFVTNQGLAKVIINQALQFVILLAAFLYFWIKKQATPGMMLLSLKLIDATSLSKPTNKQLIIRLFSCILSIIVLFIGMIWVAFDRKKQGWHDKIANTLVIKEKKKKKEIKNNP